MNENTKSYISFQESFAFQIYWKLVLNNFAESFIE